MTTAHGLPAPVQASLDQWHRMARALDMSDLASIVHPNAVFRSPVAHTPYPSREAVCLALGTVIQVFENFRYHRTFAEAGGHDVVLEFTAEVNGKALVGADFIRFDEAGLITEFMVMIRPMSGLAALAEEMGKRLGTALKTLRE